MGGAAGSERKKTLIRVRDKGQITLPLIIRDFAGVSEGDYLLCEITSEGKILLSRLDLPIEEDRGAEVQSSLL